MADGRPAKLFSSYDPTTVERHFAWMEKFGIDGVLKQRFVTAIAGAPPYYRFQNHVIHTVKVAAEKHHRAWGILYDLFNVNSTTLVQDIERDWVDYCENTLGALNSSQFLSYKGKPLVGLRLGISDNVPYTKQEAENVITFFKKRGMAVMGQVPVTWAENPQWKALYNTLDIINPWTVGRFGNQGGKDAGSPERAGIDVDRYSTNFVFRDLAATQLSGRETCPLSGRGASN